MSTTESGEEFEAKLVDLLQAELEADRFFAKKECCRLFRKKGYYSKDRQKEIVFDISVEICLPDAPTFSVLVLVECKNYGHAVPVDDAEEFFAKLQQVSGANIKGIIAASSAFQSGTFTFSKSKGIGLLRYFSETSFKWCLHRNVSMSHVDPMSLTAAEIAAALVNPAYRSQCHPCLFALEQTFGTSISGLLECLLSGGLRDPILLGAVRGQRQSDPWNVGFLSSQKIEDRAQEILARVCYCSGEVPLETVCERESADAGLVVVKVLPSADNGWSPGILGRLQFSPLRITLFDDAGWNAARQRFTLAHELGHYFLEHSQYMREEYCEASDFENGAGHNVSSDNIRRMEWQANYFASCFLLPKGSFVADFLKLAYQHDIKDRGFGLLYVDNQLCNQANYYNITNALRARYKVSRTAIKLRLEAFGLLRDVRDGSA